MANNQNLKPFTKNDPRRINKPKGAIHISTLIQNLAEELDWDKVPLKNKKELKSKYGKNGISAMIYVALGKAISGDTRAMTFLAKFGYGEKQIHSFESDLFTDKKLEITVVEDRKADN